MEFYSILFLPWDEHLDPREPTLPDLKVLPSNDSTSWENFTTIFRSWNIDTEGTNDNRGWFKRNTYKIFHNMVENMKQSSQARRLMLKWRSLVADERTAESNVSILLPQNKQFNSFNESESKEEGDDVQLIIKMLRKKHGVQGQTINDLKREEYLTDKIDKLKDIVEVHDFNNINIHNTHIPKEILEASEKPYPIYSTKECEDILKRIKGGQDILDEMMSEKEEDSDLMSASSTEIKNITDD